MCMGRTHAITGGALWTLGCGVTAAVGGHPSWATITVGSLVAAGYATWPDCDHPHSTVANTFGPPSRLAATLVAEVGSATQRLIRSQRYDRWDEDGHRTWTHTVWFAGLTAGVYLLALWGAGRWAPAVALAAVWLAAAWAVRAVVDRSALLKAVDAPTGRAWPRWLRLAVRAACHGLAVHAVALGLTAAVAAWWYWWPPAGLGWGQLAWPIAVGCLVHLAGDCLTRQGCPLIAPIPWRGHLWWHFRLPERLRLSTGHASHEAIVWVPLLLAQLGCLVGLVVLPTGYATHGTFAWVPLLLAPLGWLVGLAIA
jgi:membrane-bound metal-dependent hydrolase YbcI (DUF457 family)